MAAVAGDDNIAHALVIGAHSDGLLEPGKLDVGGQLLNAVDRIKVAVIAAEEVEVDIRDLLPALSPGVQIGHITQGSSQVKAFLFLSHFCDLLSPAAGQTGGNPPLRRSGDC